MPRVKRGTIGIKRRRKVLKQVKGFRFARGSKERMAKEALLHAGKYSFAHRRAKKNDFRRLFQIKIGAAVREKGTSYSKFIGALKKHNISLERKVLADLAQNKPEVFARILEKVGK